MRKVDSIVGTQKGNVQADITRWFTSVVRPNIVSQMRRPALDCRALMHDRTAIVSTLVTGSHCLPITLSRLSCLTSILA